MIGPVDHARFAPYYQLVGSQAEAGYTPLAGAKDGRYGWNMPIDQATDEFFTNDQSRVSGVRRRYLEVGAGDGERVTLRLLRQQNCEMVAVDIVRDLLAALEESASRVQTGSRLRTFEVARDWWDNEAGLDYVSTRTGIVDVIVARQVLQFGTARTVANALRLAGHLLAPGGYMWMHNMSPFLRYLYESPWPGGEGGLLTALLEKDEAFAGNPGSMELPAETGSQHVFGSVAFPEQAKNIARFTWFSESFLRGALTLSGAPLKVCAQYYFSPASIWDANKLFGPPELREREIHVAVLTRKEDECDWPAGLRDGARKESNDESDGG